MFGVWGLLPLWLGSAFHQFLLDDTNVFHCATYEISTTPSTCYSFGEPHILTFDGVTVDHPGYGDYYLVYSSSPSGVNIVARQAECMRSISQLGTGSKFNCNRAFSIQTNNIYVTIAYDDVALAVTTKYYNGNWTVFVGDMVIPGFGSITVLSLENMGFQVDVTIGTATISMSWLGMTAGVIQIPSQLQPAGTSGLCGFYDGCQYNDLLLRLRTDYWWDTTLEALVNSSVYLSGYMDEGYGYVYAGPSAPEHQPLLPLTANRTMVSKYFASSWLLAGEEAVQYFGDTLGSKSFHQLPLENEDPPANSACFPSGYLPDGMKPPAFLLEACLQDVAVGGAAAARGAHEVFLLLCDGFCSTQSFANPNDQLLALQCSTICAPSTPLNLHQNYTTNVPVSFTVGEGSSFSPLALGGRYIAELQTHDQCEIAITDLIVDVICVEDPTSVISAGGNKTLKRGWYGYPKVLLQGSSSSRAEQTHWAILDWPGKALGLSSPVINREWSRFPWWVPQNSGAHLIEMAVYDGCAISRVQIEVMVNCTPFASVSVDGPRSVLWSSSTFEILNLTYELDYSSFRVQNDLPMEWSLVFLATVPIPGANASNTSAPQTMQAYIEPPPGSALPFGSGEVELTSINATDKVYTIFAYQSAMYHQPFLNQSSTSSVSTTVQEPVVSTPLTTTNEWGLYYFRSGTMQTTTTIASTTTTVSKDYLQSRRQAVCTVNLQHVTSPVMLVAWTPVTLGRDCTGFFRVQVSTNVDQEILDPCNAIKDEVVVDLSCGAAPTALVNAPTLVTFNYSTNGFSPVRVVLEAVYDTLQRSNMVYTYSAALIPPAGSALPANQPLSISADPDGQAVSFVPDIAGTFEVQMTAANGCEDSVSVVSIVATCSESSRVMINPNHTSFSDSQGLYINDPFTFDIEGSYHGSNHNNPLPPVVTSIVRSGPALPTQVTIPSYSVLGSGTGPYEVLLGISGLYDVTVSFTNMCGQRTAQTQRFTVTSTYNNGVTSCGFPNKTQSVPGRNGTDPYEDFVLDAAFTPPTNTDTHTWTLRSAPFGSAVTVNPLQTSLTPDVAGVYIVDLVATGELGWCMDTVTLTAGDCVTPNLVIQGGQRSVSVALGADFTLFFADPDNEVTTYRWSSPNSPLSLAQVASQTLTISQPGVFTFLFEYDTECTANFTHHVTITLTVTCPGTTAASAFVGSGNPATVTFASRAFPRMYFNGASSNLRGRNPMSPEFANSTWFVLSAPADSVYTAGTSSTQSVTVNQPVTSVDSGRPGLNWVQRINATIASTTTTMWKPVLPLSQLAGLWTSFLDPDVAGTYTLRFTLADYCGTTSSTLTLNAVCIGSSVVVSVSPVDSFLSLSSSSVLTNEDDYVPTSQPWLTAYQTTNSNRRVVLLAEFPATSPITGRVILRQVDPTSATEIFLELATATVGAPMNYSWAVLNGNCATQTQTVFNINSNPLSNDRNSTWYLTNCLGGLNDNNCQTGDLAGKFGELPLNNTMLDLNFEDNNLPVRDPTNSLHGKSIGIRLSNSPNYVACAPIMEYQTYFASLSRGWSRRVSIDASGSTAGGGGGELSYKWSWYFSGAPIGGKYIYNTFLDHRNDSIANALGSLEQSSSAIASFLIHQKGVYVFKPEIWNGCSKSSTVIVIDADCGTPLDVVEPQTLRVSLTDTEPALTTAPFLSFDLGANTSRLTVAQPSLMQWRVATYISPGDLNAILSAQLKSSAHSLPAFASFCLLAATVLLTVFVGPIH